MNKTVKDKISHISRRGSSIIPDSIVLIIIINGIADKKVIPKAIGFLAFPMMINTANISHRNTIEVADIGVPIENIFFIFIIILNKYRYGTVKILNDIKLNLIPFLPKIILGNVISHAITDELTGIGDHVSVPDIAKSQIRHTIIPVKSTAEKTADMIIFFLSILLSVPFCTVKFLSVFFSYLSVQAFSPFNSSFTVIPSISQSSNIIEASGILFPVSHFDTALSVIFSFSANCA